MSATATTLGQLVDSAALLFRPRAPHETNHATQLDMLRSMCLDHLKVVVSSNYMNQGHSEQRAGILKLASKLGTTMETRDNIRKKGFRANMKGTGRHLMNFVVRASGFEPHQLPPPTPHQLLTNSSPTLHQPPIDRPTPIAVDRLCATCCSGCSEYTRNSVERAVRKSCSAADCVDSAN